MTRFTAMLFKKEFTIQLLIQLTNFYQVFSHAEMNPRNFTADVELQTNISIDEKLYPQKINIIESTSIFLYCPNDPNGVNQFKTCRITHEKCKFEQTHVDNTLTQPTIDCASIENNTVFTFNSTYCILNLKSVVMEDSGKWQCMLETMEDQNGLRKIIHSEVILNITPKPPPIIVHPSKQTAKYDNMNFVLAKFGQEQTTLHAGQDVILNCEVNDNYDSCIFRHKSKSCEFKSERTWAVYHYHWEQTIIKCDGYPDKIAPVHNEEHDSLKCAIQLISVMLDDEGYWSCDLRSWDDNVSMAHGLMLLNISDSHIVFPITHIEYQEDGQTLLATSGKSPIFPIIAMLVFILINGLIIFYVYHKRKLSTKSLEHRQSTNIIQNHYHNDAYNIDNDEVIYEEISYENPKELNNSPNIIDVP